jgi:hypothetical protein
MKRLNLFLIVLLGFLIAACATITAVSAQHDFDAFLGNTINDDDIDGDIGVEWDDAGTYTDVAIDPQGTAEFWSKHDGTYLYMAVRFTADSDNAWVSFLFGGTTCMAADTDGALFGHDDYSANGYQDISFNGYTAITVDASQDGKGEMLVDNSNVVTVELKKPLNSGDSDGKDAAWTEGNTYAMIIMWNSNSYGSSGGSTTHSEGSLTDRTILINSNAIPELPGLMFTAILIATAITAFLLRKRITTKPVANLTS